MPGPVRQKCVKHHNSDLQKIHDNLNKDDDDDDEKDSFNPPPNPQSAGVQKTIPKTENFVPVGSSSQFIGKSPSPNYEGGDNLDLNDYKNSHFIFISREISSH